VCGGFFGGVRRQLAAEMPLYQTAVLSVLRRHVYVKALVVGRRSMSCSERIVRTAACAKQAYLRFVGFGARHAVP